MLPQPHQRIPFWQVPLSGILLFACWPMSPLTPLVFVALVPLFYAEYFTENGARFFGIALLNMLIWNAATTWWIWNSTPAGALGAIIANSLIMCFPIMLYRFVRRRNKLVLALIGFAAFWIAYEYLHHNWDLSWPWLTLGNVFATHPDWVQWYEYTGTTGGTLWVIAVNAMLFLLLLKRRRGHTIVKSILVAAALIVLPLIFSLLIKPSPIHADASPNVVVVQPNVEPYTEKFNVPPQELVADLLNLTNQQADSSTALILWPETAIPGNIWENTIEDAQILFPVKDYVARHPKSSILTGIESLRFFGLENPGRFSIRTMDNGNYYEAYNTALYLQPAGPLGLYHKAKLVPGVETLPSWLSFMSTLFDDFGGISGSLGRSEEATVFSAQGNLYKPAPIICYESIYSDYTTEYVRNGSNLLTVITNDGWWKETPGHRQHMHMSRLRAIENRRWVARSANTGISCFINERGEIMQQLGWDEKGVLKMNVPAIEKMTFYSKKGDWISRITWPFAIILLLWTIVSHKFYKNTKNN